MKIDGTVKISIETFEKLKAEADKKDEAEKKLQGLINAVLATCAFDDKEFLKECEKIDNDDTLSDRQISKALNEARKKLKIMIKADRLKSVLKMAAVNTKPKNISVGVEELYTTAQSIIDEMEIKLI